MDPRFNIFTETTSFDTVWGMPNRVCWIIIAILLLVSGLFSASENAYSNCNKYHFKALANKGNFTAKLITRLVDKFDSTLVTVLVGNNIAQTLMSFLSAILFYNFCKQAGISDGVEAILSTIVMAALVYIVSDTVPKILSKAIPNRMAIFLAYPVAFTGIILFLPIFIFKGVLWLVHKIFKIKDQNILSNEDLIHSASVAINDELGEDEKEEKLFENNEKEMLDKVFSFNTLKIKDVYTPRDKVVAIDIDNLSITKLNSILIDTNFSRFPVYDKSKEDVVGVLVLKTYFEEYSKDQHLDIRSILEKPIYVDIDDNIDDVFKLLNLEKVHLGIVKNKGDIVGVVSMEDILEELVDDINEKPADKLKWRQHE